MRYTRNRQMKQFDYSWGCVSCKKIDDYWRKTNPSIDKYFKWHHDFVWEIEKYWESYITLGTYGQDDFKIIPIK